MTGDARRVLVTGAGSGLGRAIAEHLASRGDHVVGTVRDPGRASALTAERTGLGLASDMRTGALPSAASLSGALSFASLELSEKTHIDALADRMLADGGVDVLVHNAGFGVLGPVEEVDDEEVERQLAVHVFGPLRLTRRLLPSLRERRGRILWMGSLGGRIALPFQAHYSASKAAIASLSDALRIELSPHGVQVCCIEPGDFATGFTESRRCVGQESSPYREQVRRCREAVERTERDGADPRWVARVVDEVSRRNRMPARVPVGRWAKTIALMRRMLPDAAAERAVRAIYGC